jgi:oxalate decarboxylase/phosphoglucose isomerase-like protein (cupin superfamily)
MRRAILFLFITSLLTAQSAPEVEITAEPHHHQIFVNDQVRVFNVDVPPHTDTLLHWHRHDYIYVTLGDSEVVNAVQGKAAVNVTLRDGQTDLLHSPYAHVAHNQSDKPFRNVTIELLQDDQLRHSTHQWDESRGLDIFPGGTKEILWVKDAVRATEFELQPGGMIPEHHHTGSHLVVALTDYTLRSDQPGKPPTTSSMKTGDTKWVPGGFTHTLMNTGTTPARFVALEFP